MSWPVYSARFLEVSLAGDWVWWYCPAGHVAVLKCLTFTNTSASAAASGYAAVSGVYVWSRSYPAQASEVVGSMHVVFTEGEGVGLYTPGPAMHMTASGYLLSGEDVSGRGVAGIAEAPAGGPAYDRLALEQVVDELGPRRAPDPLF